MARRQSFESSLGYESGAVLVVDDSRADLRWIEQSLKSLGLSVRECTDAYGAMASLYEQEFAVALVDVRMPGLDGFELAAEIRRHPRASGLPIIFVTASELTREELRRAYSLLAVDVITKPIVPEVLRAKVSVFVELERRRHAAARRLELEELVLATAQTAHGPVRMLNHLLRELHGSVGRAGGEDVASVLSSLRGQARRASRLLSGLAQLSGLRLEPEEMCELDLRDPISMAVRDVEAELSAAQGSIDVGAIPRVHAHAEQMRLLFRELFDNAIKFRADSPPRIRVRGERGPAEVVVSVEDDGVGIPPERSHRVFELFRPLHGGPRLQEGVEAGMGMGLALAQRIVHLNGGRIWCEPGEGGRGTRLSFTVPEAADTSSSE